MGRDPARARRIDQGPLPRPIPPGWSIDTNTPEGKKRLLEFWLTTEEEDYQIVPNADGEALVAYLLALRKAEVPLPEAKE